MGTMLLFSDLSLLASMMVFNAWRLLEISNWLSDIGFEPGRDYCWAWHNNSWAIEFKDTKQELVAMLKWKELE